MVYWHSLVKIIFEKPDFIKIREFLDRIIIKFRRSASLKVLRTANVVECANESQDGNTVLTG